MNDTGLVRENDAGSPNITAASFIAPGSVIVGPVTIEEGASVWFGCVLRSESEPITVGERCSIQDGCVVHADPGYPVRMGRRVTVGHGAIVHGAVIEDDVLIGIRSVILNGARIGKGSVIAAGAVVRPGVEVPPDSLAAGVPAIVRRSTSAEEREIIRRTPSNYLAKAAAYRSTFLPNGTARSDPPR